MVITTDTGDTVAVLNVPAGEQNITSMIETIIKEHECADSAKLEFNSEDKNIVDSLEAYIFAVETETDGDIDLRDYYIQATASYNVQN